MSNRNQGRTTTVMKLRLLFHEYYSDSTKPLDVPDKIYSREFALQTWEHNWHCVEHKGKDKTGKQVQTGCGKSGKSFQPVKTCPNCGSGEVKSTSWIRHVGYQSRDDLRAGLATSAPQSVYHSAAFYKVPIATHMHEKEWQGAELVFDIDADHLDLKCAKDHDAWRCNNPDCHKTGTGLPPEKCPVCENSSFSTRKWICENCLDTARKHVIRLIDSFLVDDFNFDIDKIQINYSGHRGFHVRVRDSKIYMLDTNARVEIVHYILGLGFRSEKAIIEQGGINLIPARGSPGWNGKIADAIIELIQHIDDYPGQERWAAKLRNKKNKELRLAVLSGLHREKPILSKGMGLKTWQEITDRAIESFHSEIDKPVTHDIHRVIRLIGSLHGKTGFIASQLTRDELDDFDPFVESIAFNQGTMKVNFHKGPAVPKFKIGNETYGPFTKEESVEFPMAAAVFVLCKGVASIE